MNILLTEKEVGRRLDKFLKAHPDAQWDSTMAFGDMAGYQAQKIIKLLDWLNIMEGNEDGLALTPIDWQEIRKEVLGDKTKPKVSE